MSKNCKEKNDFFICPKNCSICPLSLKNVKSSRSSRRERLRNSPLFTQDLRNRLQRNSKNIFKRLHFWKRFHHVLKIFFARPQCCYCIKQLQTNDMSKNCKEKNDFFICPKNCSICPLSLKNVMFLSIFRDSVRSVFQISFRNPPQLSPRDFLSNKC